MFTFFRKLIYFAIARFAAIVGGLDCITQLLITKNIEGVVMWAKSADDVHVTSSHTTQRQSIVNTQRSWMA